jgi:hypothetical protein
MTTNKVRENISTIRRYSDSWKCLCQIGLNFSWSKIANDMTTNEAIENISTIRR